MTSANARAVGNVVLISAGVAAAYVVITTPPLRRLVVRGFQLWLGASIPAYVTSQVKEAWAQSARPRNMAQGRPGHEGQSS
jgi:hypothetical protein